MKNHEIEKMGANTLGIDIDIGYLFTPNPFFIFTPNPFFISLSNAIKNGDIEGFRAQLRRNTYSINDFLVEYQEDGVPIIQPENFNGKKFSIFSLIGSLGNNKYLEVLKEHGIDIHGGDYTIFRYAAANGHLDMLKWLKNQRPNDINRMLCASNKKEYKRFEYERFEEYAAFILAAKNQHIEVVKWLLEQFPERKNRDSMICAKGGIAIEDAICNENLDLLTLLLDATDEKSKIVFCHTIFEIAIKQGHIKILKYLVEQMPAEKKINWIESNARSIIMVSAMNGKNCNEVIEWINGIVNIPEKLKSDIDKKLFRRAAQESKIDILKGIIERTPAPDRNKLIRSYDDSPTGEERFVESISNGKFEVSKLLLNKVSNNEIRSNMIDNVIKFSENLVLCEGNTNPIKNISRVFKLLAPFRLICKNLEEKLPADVWLNIFSQLFHRVSDKITIDAVWNMLSTFSSLSNQHSESSKPVINSYELKSDGVEQSRELEGTRLSPLPISYTTMITTATSSTITITNTSAITTITYATTTALSTAFAGRGNVTTPNINNNAINPAVLGFANTQQNTQSMPPPGM